MRTNRVYGARHPRCQSHARLPKRDAEGFLKITIPARLASGAQQNGEHAQVFIYCAARALDVRGAGRIEIGELAHELRFAYRGGRISRWLDHEKAVRYWSVDRGFVRLHGMAAVIASFDCELPNHDLAIMFSLGVLRTRQQRGAALLAALVGTSGEPRSLEYIWKFARVNRKTLSTWKRDPVIRSQILRPLTQWARI